MVPLSTALFLGWTISLKLFFSTFSELGEQPDWDEEHWEQRKRHKEEEEERLKGQWVEPIGDWPSHPHLPNHRGPTFLCSSAYSYS
jgi:hypothetical protein